MSDRICIASGDDHAGAPLKVYRDYLDPWLRPAFDDFYDRHISRFSTTQQPGSFFAPESNAKFWKTAGYDPILGTPVAWDADLRIKEMDAALVACSLLFPDDTNSNDPPWGSGLTIAFQEGSPSANSGVPLPFVRAGARAYNRWLADHISTDPVRLNGVIILGTSDDLVWCVEEIHRAYESGVTGGVLLPLEHEQPLFHHPRYNLLWDTCVELDLPVISHIGRGHPTYAGDDPFVQKIFYGFELMQHAQRPIWTLIMGGVLERYPDLRVVVAETGVEWVPQMVALLEQLFDSARFGVPDEARNVPGRVDFSLRPKEYWERQVSIIHSVNQLRHQFEHEAYTKVPNMIFGVDMCHFEGWWPMMGYPEPRPQSLSPLGLSLPVVPIDEAYERTFSGLLVTDVVPYLETNFFDTFRTYDRKALQPVVDRIGPTVDDLGLQV